MDVSIWPVPSTSVLGSPVCQNSPHHPLLDGPCESPSTLNVKQVPLTLGGVVLTAARFASLCSHPSPWLASSKDTTGLGKRPELEILVLY